MHEDYIRILAMFASHFTPQTWEQAQVLVTGAILARGQRTVTAVLRVMGLSDESHFVNYHRVLNRAAWSAIAVRSLPNGVGGRYWNRPGRSTRTMAMTAAPTRPVT